MEFPKTVAGKLRNIQAAIQALQVEQQGYLNGFFDALGIDTTNLNVNLDTFTYEVAEPVDPLMEMFPGATIVRGEDGSVSVNMNNGGEASIEAVEVIEGSNNEASNEVS